MKNKVGIYIHVPFCVKKCAYCDFYSLTRLDMIKSYTEALRAHIESASKTYSGSVVDTVFFGGGTPSLLPSASFESITSALFDNFDIYPDAEISVEINPATVDKDKIETFKRCKVNRISMGMQTALDSELSLLGRIHDSGDLYKTYSLLRSEGISNINLDLMYGIPGQSMDSLEESLTAAVSLSPEHISVYGLKIEKDTLFARHPENYSFPDDDLQSDMYLEICSKLQSAGYSRYEMSNFTLPGYECRHNLKYWNRENYVGFGPAAASFVNGTRYTYSRDLVSYINSVNEGREPECSERRKLTNTDIKNERIMLGLRLEKGIPENELPKEKTEVYIKNRFMKVRNGRISFTDKGMLVSNYILSELID